LEPDVANNPEWYDATVIAAVNAAAALLNSGFIEIYSGSQPANDASLTGTKLAKLAFSATAFPAATAASGTVTATANAITAAAALATGTAGYFALMKSDDATVVMTGSVGTSGADLNLSSLSITSGVNVSCSSFAITELQN
jgi:hypothetical protein